MKASIAIASITLLGSLASAGTQAGEVRCHVIYGGEEWIVDAAPTATPYKVANRKIGRYFEFKVVQAELPSAGRFVRIYTYGISTGDPVLIHQASFRPPPGVASTTFSSSTRSYTFLVMNPVSGLSVPSAMRYTVERSAWLTHTLGSLVASARSLM